MARNYVRYRPNRGLNIVQPKAALNAGQCYRAENVVFTRKSVKRRRGKLASHKVALTSVAAAVTMLKRFYNLATTGTVSKVFLKAFGAVLYGTTTDWSDDTRTPITTAQWTNIPYPNTANNSLYDGYSSVTAEPVSGGIESAVASKSWCYIQSNVSSANDSAKTKGVPIRTQGGKAFLHGLPPPAALTSSVTELSDLPATADLNFQTIYGSSTSNASPKISKNASTICIVSLDINLPGPVTTVRVSTRPVGSATWTHSAPSTDDVDYVDGAIGSDGTIHVCYHYTTGAANDLRYRSGTHGSWSGATAIDTGGDVGSYCAMAVDSGGVPHIAYYDTTNTNLKYAFKAGSSFTVENIDTTGSVGTFASIAIDDDGIPHVAYYDATNSRLKYAHRKNGTWTIEVADDPANNVGTVTSIAIDSLGAPAIVYRDVTGGDLYYVSRRGGSWNASEAVDTSFDPDDSTSLVFDDDDIPYVLYANAGAADVKVATSTATVAGTWSKNTIETTHAYVDWLFESDIFYTTMISGGILFSDIHRNKYVYRLTAEYDNGILGESCPSVAFSGAFWDNEDISEENTHVIGLNTGTPTYDMTDDVNKIHIYRTIKGGNTDSPLYRVGSVDCTSGAPDADFTDNVTDTDLVANRILDIDRYMPPKWLTGVIWKDRMVIGNLKCRDISTTEGSVDSLDLENDGIHKNRIRFSEGFHPDVFKANFVQDILPDGDSGSIKRLIVNPQSDSLFVFMENDVVALTDPVGDLVTALSYRPRNVANSHGTPARHSVVEYEGLIFYWTKNGIEVINGLTARNITSDTIGNLWNMTNSNHPAYASRINMSQISKVAGTAHVDEAGERIYWAYPAASNSYNNRVLVLDFARWRDSGFNDDGVFSIWTMDISCWARWDGEGDRGELFGGEALNTRGPWVHRVGISNQDEVGNTSGTITTSAVSPFYIHTGHDDAGTAERRKRWITARVDGRIPTVASTGSCSVALAFDVDEGAVSGTMDTVTWTQGGIKRYSRNLPRAAIGVHGAVEITGTDGTPGASGGSPPFELYEIAMTVQDMEARTARG